MIQRIQTLWLFFATLVLSGLFLFPFVNFIDLVGLGKQIYVTGMYSANNNARVQESSSVLLTVYAGLVALLPLCIIFLYKNRKQQMRFIMIEIALTILLGVWMWSQAFATLETINQTVGVNNVGVGYFLLPVAVILLAMAIGGIRKDEKLIKSADRLR